VRANPPTTFQHHSQRRVSYPARVPRQYRIALYDRHGEVIEGARYTHVSEQTPMRGLQIDLPRGTWFVHEVVATWSEDTSSQLHRSDPHCGGTLICRPEPPEYDS
jgi:hypothetical protein